MSVTRQGVDNFGQLEADRCRLRISLTHEHSRASPDASRCAAAIRSTQFLCRRQKSHQIGIGHSHNREFYGNDGGKLRHIST